MVVWQKPNVMPDSVKDRLIKSYEHIIVLTKKKKYYWDHKASQEKGTTQEKRNMRDVWTINAGTFKGAHFATFPIELPKRCIKLARKKGDRVLDPFNGSGTTGCAALELGRKYIGLDLHYHDLAEQRIQKHKEQNTHGA
jgi:site-specific DNA-methyltransferase (cytosine-N4-specific)